MRIHLIIQQLRDFLLLLKNQKLYRIWKLSHCWSENSIQKMLCTKFSLFLFSLSISLHCNINQMCNNIMKWSLSHICLDIMFQRSMSEFHCICRQNLKKKTAVTMYVICSVLLSISSLLYNISSSCLWSSINSCLYWFLTSHWCFSVV